MPNPLLKVHTSVERFVLNHNSRIAELKETLASRNSMLDRLNASNERLTAENKALELEIALQKGANAAQDERERIAAERLGMVHNCDWPGEVADEVIALKLRLQKLEGRYAFAENQRLCVDSTCDGDLTATPHDDGCPAKINDMKLRPHLYAPDEGITAS